MRDPSDGYPIGSVSKGPATIHLTATAMWRREAEAASASWPASVGLRLYDCPDSDLAESSGSAAFFDPDPSDAAWALVVATAGHASAAPLQMPQPTVGRAVAFIVGAASMSPDTITGWAHRALLGTASPLIGEAIGWTIADRVAEFDMPHDARASHQARTAIRSVLEVDDPVDDVILATSELTANAVQHGGGAVRLTAARRGSALTVAVTDRRGDRVPSVQRMRGPSSNGRGMAIVDTICDHWGVTAYHDHKMVWCSFGTSAQVRPVRSPVVG